MTGIWVGGKRWELSPQGNYALYVDRTDGDGYVDRDYYGFVDTEDDAKTIAQGWNKDHESRSPYKMEYAGAQS